MRCCAAAPAALASTSMSSPLLSSSLELLLLSPPPPSGCGSTARLCIALSFPRRLPSHSRTHTVMKPRHVRCSPLCPKPHLSDQNLQHCLLGCQAALTCDRVDCSTHHGLGHRITGRLMVHKWPSCGCTPACRQPGSVAHAPPLRRGPKGLSDRQYAALGGCGVPGRRRVG